VADALRTPLTELLGIRYPILLAAMAGAPTTAELIGEVTRAGGLGVLGLTGMTAEQAAQLVHTARKRALGGPVGVNAQLAAATPPTGDRDEILAVLAPFRAELGLPAEPPPAPPADAPLALVEAGVAAGASLITTFEDPAPAIPLARSAGIPLLAMVTTPAEAEQAVAAGVDGVIAQGIEAGGHRGAFLGAGEPAGPALGTLALVAKVVEAVGSDVPVVASGGIMDGRGIAAALARGAAGVSLGTRFLAALEAGVPDCYRTALAACPPDGTVVTAAVTGRPARWVRNRVVSALVEADCGTLGWGAQAALIADLRGAAARQERCDLLPMLAGEAAGLIGEPMPAAEIVVALVAEAGAACS
jgi:nitronate monooxygenase